MFPPLLDGTWPNKITEDVNPLLHPSFDGTWLNKVTEDVNLLFPTPFGGISLIKFWEGVNFGRPSFATPSMERDVRPLV